MESPFYLISIMEFAFKLRWRAALVGMVMFSACTHLEEYELKYQGDIVVVNGRMKNEEPIAVQLSHSQNPSGKIKEDVSIADARVQLFEDGVVKEQLEAVGDGLYRSNLIPDEGIFYQLEVTANGYPDVITEQEVIPKAFPLVDYSVEFKEDVTGSSQNNDGYELFLKINDSGQSEDYYEFEVFGIHPQLGEIHVYTSIFGDFEVNNPCVIYPDFGGIMLKDECYNGQEFIVNLEFANSGDIELVDGFEKYTFTRFHIALRNVSKSYYRYKESTIISQGIDNAFFEPKITRSNVIGGYGIFEAYHETILDLNF